MSRSVTDDEPRSIDADNYFAIIPEWVLYADISAQAVRLYAVIRRFADAESKAWPSRRTLADRMMVSSKTVDRALAELVDIGALKVSHRFDASGDMTTNLYVVRSTNPGVGTPVSPPLDADVEGGRDTCVEGGGDTRVSQNQSQIQPEPFQPEERPFSGSDSEQWQDAVELCSFLSQKISENGSKTPVVTRRWIETMEKMIRIDKRSPESIYRAIEWSQANDFWRSNILSPDALRKQFDRMRLQAKRDRAKQPRGLAAVAEFLERSGG